MSQEQKCLGQGKEIDFVFRPFPDQILIENSTEFLLASILGELKELNKNFSTLAEIAAKEKENDGRTTKRNNQHSK